MSQSLYSVYPIKFTWVKTKFGRALTLRLYRCVVSITIGKPPWVKYYSRVRVYFKRIYWGAQIHITMRPFELKWRLQWVKPQIRKRWKPYKCPECDYEASLATFRSGKKYNEHES